MVAPPMCDCTTLCISKSPKSPSDRLGPAGAGGPDHEWSPLRSADWRAEMSTERRGRQLIRESSALPKAVERRRRLGTREPKLSGSCEAVSIAQTDLEMPIDATSILIACDAQRDARRQHSSSWGGCHRSGVTLLFHLQLSIMLHDGDATGGGHAWDSRL